VVRPPYPVAVRLCLIAAERWAELDAAYYQIRLLRERPHRFANLVYSWCIERVEPDKLDDWLSELNELLPWQDADSAAAVDMESESFFAMQGKGGG
jgi:hypothetical protein